MMGKTPVTEFRELTMAEMMKYHHPAEILGYCSQCPNYGHFWSCPPHKSPISEYLGLFDSAYIFGTRVYRDRDHQMNENGLLVRYHHWKKRINQILLDNERLFPDSQVLISGHCEICGTCRRIMGESCIRPTTQRYSAESLGFKVSAMIEDFFGDTLQWEGGGTPPYLYIVTGLLSERKADREVLQELLNQF